MPLPARRWLFVGVLGAALVYALLNFTSWYSIPTRTGFQPGEPLSGNSPLAMPSTLPSNDGVFRWKDLQPQYPVTSMKAMPSGRTVRIPKIQHEFNVKETAETKEVREARLKTVRESFEHAWKGYKQHAWMKDEVSPVSGGYRDTFGGWAATLVDSLDTLWIMGLRDDFDAAIAEVSKIDFSKSTEDELNVFETTIRYLGGFLAAYDLSGFPVLLQKAVELGEMLYVAFDTPNRMPMTRWKWKEAAQRKSQEAGAWVLVAELGSLTLEFTRLSQLSGDPKYFDAIQRITDQFVLQQNKTKLPGMWPVVVNAKDMDFVGDNTFSLGAMSDSLYEYLPKQYMLLGGLADEYRTLYEGSINSAKQYNFFRPLNPSNLDILISGTIRATDGRLDLEPQGQHLVCFAGGMVGIGAKIFGRDEVGIARKLVEGCIWAYESTPTGIMPETFHAIACKKDDCQWDEAKWHQGILSRQNDHQGNADSYIKDKRLPPGYTDIADRRYILRPEAIESVFILYRITGDVSLQDKAWKMFQAIDKYTKTDVANAALDDITVMEPPKSDRMESFWTAETLKYFYLIFSTPDVISLDDYVLNTEAHPLQRPKSKGFLKWW